MKIVSIVQILLFLFYTNYCFGNSELVKNNLKMPKKIISDIKKTKATLKKLVTVEDFKSCKSRDIIDYLPPFASEKMNTETLYLGMMDIIQKTPDGFLMTPKLLKGGGAPPSVLFVKMNPRWSSRTFSGWFYLIGEYEYVGLDGFERKIPMLQVYEGNILLKSCEEGKPQACPERNSQGCI